MAQQDSGGGSRGCGCGGLDRREFLKAAAGAGAMAAGLPMAWGAAGTSTLADFEKLLPVEKKLPPEWVKSLFERGIRKAYQGKELETIGMPCGGIAAGQIYVRGDGTLAQWWIFNHAPNTAAGDRCYTTYRPASPIAQGFALRVKGAQGPAVVRKLSGDDFDAIEFIGEYPIAEIRYRTKDKPALPVEVNSEVFSPFIPLNARDSAMPVTMLRFTVKNTSSAVVDVAIGGWLQNAVCLQHAGTPRLLSRNQVVRDAGLTSVRMDLFEAPAQKPAEARRVTVFEDFEDGTYDRWTITGDAFGKTPATGKSETQQPVAGWRGKYFVNTFQPDDKPQGTATSKVFKIAEPFICFLIGGGNHPGTTCLNLLVDGKVVRTATGKDTEQLLPAHWNVSDLIGKEAQLQIVDKESGPWGHISVDYIHFSNLPPEQAGGFTKNDPGLGDMSLTAMDAGATACAGWISEDAFLTDLAEDGKLSGGDVEMYALGTARCGAAASSARLAAGESKTMTFLVSWYFPNRAQTGNMYGNWFKDSVEVAQYVAKNFDRLNAETHLFRDTYLDTTLPYWFMARLVMPASILATETCQWWRNGRFYAWEGVGCCHGTCTHVWNYEHACARLFPELSRATRQMQDLGVAFDEKTGLVGFRGAREYAADGQCGTILKIYREHLMSADAGFLKGAWPRTKKALEYLTNLDGDANGIIEATQHNTYDINFEGPNTFVGSLYLAALRAGEEMAKIMGEEELAKQYRAIFEKGRAFTVEKLWNGEYFTQIIPQGKPDRFQYGNGCLADQLFGQGWAWQLGLGYIYPKGNVTKALDSVFKYNFTMDIGPYNKVFPPQRWFARDGEAGLFICTWPKGGRPAEPVLYRDEVWTGIEYQVAGHMLYEGMLREGMAIVRAAHDRYDGVKHNPWNEVECGDHYARAMASWGCLLGIEGFVYDGPGGKIGFAPKLGAEGFKAFFTAAEGWGSLVQKREGKVQVNRIEVKRGKVRCGMLLLESPGEAKVTEATVAVGGEAAGVEYKQEGAVVTLKLRGTVVVNEGEAMEVRMTWA